RQQDFEGSAVPDLSVEHPGGPERERDFVAGVLLERGGDLFGRRREIGGDRDRHLPRTGEGRDEDKQEQTSAANLHEQPPQLLTARMTWDALISAQARTPGLSLSLRMLSLVTMATTDLPPPRSMTTSPFTAPSTERDTTPHRWLRAL